MFSLDSPIEVYGFKGHRFFLKRDDLLDRAFSGNKARKLYYFLSRDFPHITTLVSYGSAQSNAMYSLSVLAKRKGWEFLYVAHHISEYLAQNPQGNYKAALKNGMRVISDAQLHESGILNEKKTLFIEEGGRQKEAAVGITLLAKEIVMWQKEQQIRSLNIFLPSGTGTTALFLSKALLRMEMTNRVYTTPCVGDSGYLKKQFFALEYDETYHPKIIALEKKHHFGKLYRDNYEIWLELREEMGVEFDLLYDPLGWRTLLAFAEVYEKKPLLYIHQGGLLGNESMLPRYERKWKKDENIT